MKPTSLVLLSALCASPLFADAGQKLIPAGSLIGCTISEPKLSSRTTAVGDPVLCQVGHSERYGRSVMPYNSYLVGRFEDYKDPGHFVGKGWMQLKFDRMVVEPDTVIPIDARVVDVPGYRVDNQGRILGKGHATRDAVLWSIPILWPVDLLMLPMRGPRPTLKEETRLTLKVMDDLAVPINQPPTQDPYGLTHRPTAENEPPSGPMPDQEPAPENAYAPQPEPQFQPEPQPQPEYAYAPPPPPVMAYAPMMVAPPPIIAYNPYSPMVIGLRGAYGYGYAPRAYAARPYGYGGYAPRGYGYASRGYAAAPGRGPQGYYGGGRPAVTARAGMSYGGGGYRR
jgi:hypothetical protein